MANRNKAHTIQVGPVSKITAPDDPLSLLPKELLDNIYSLALHSEDGPWTFHIKSTVRPWPYGSNNDLDRLLSVLALPQDRRYKARRMENPEEVWPDNVERACFRALDWAYRHKGGYYDDLISEIIYELTGIRLCRKKISSHIQLLKKWAYDMEPASKHILAEVLEPSSALRYLNSTDHIETITYYIQDIQAKLPKLLGAFKKEHKTAILLPPKPVVLLRPLSSLTVTANAGILRLLSTIASDPTSILSTQATCDSIKRVRLTFVEGSMPLCFVRSLGSSVLSVLPKLRELFVELWPRNPAREEETVTLLEALRGVRARVVVGFRWQSDCDLTRGKGGENGQKRNPASLLIEPSENMRNIILIQDHR
ncbi:MAG: hypothetical protein ASARMPREDX12_008085 [Alectoria sarmentosa]|nr:MAG: hypothetical protein ASARMPREDX12_008085 [Alectoria sarmentosa]